MTAPWIPTIIDYGTDDDAGFWLAARPFVQFPWLDYDPVQNTGRSRPNSDCFDALISFNHASGVAQ